MFVIFVVPKKNNLIHLLLYIAFHFVFILNLALVSIYLNFVSILCFLVVYLHFYKIHMFKSQYFLFIA